MKEAMHWKKLQGNIVQCVLCPRYCVIKDGKRGNCRVRENRKGKLFALTYAKPCSVALDPIEKKPFYHFFPGSKALSIATAGCNFHCLHCQNYEISQARPEDVPSTNMPPEAVVQEAKRMGAESISYTYTEPVVFYEYMIDIAKLAKKEGIKNNTVTNGFINPEPLKELCKYLDGSNIDIKGNKKFYEEVCSAKLEPVLEAIKIMHEKKVWIELTNLIISGYNDNEKDMKEIINFVKKIDINMPLHFSAFYPCYKMLSVPLTPQEILIKARMLAKKEGLNYVYTGNILDEEGSTTFCPGCKKALIRRIGYGIKENNVINGKCKFCNEKIAGVWK